jgi:4'-phosphopantetheinyl transferase
LSHSQSLALYAFTYERDVGIDVEYIRPIAEFEDIAERFFSRQEYTALHALTAEKKLEAFFNCWTRKEAFLKATAVGLAQPLNQFEVSLVPGEPAVLLSVDGDFQKAAPWSLQDLKPAGGYTAALAVRGHNWRLVRLNWSEWE